jgi:hypothetical protein
LGYVHVTSVVDKEADKSGVTVHDPELCHPGYNLFNTRTSNLALLMNMDGEVVHEWHSGDLEGAWHHVEMMPTGDLLVLVKGGYLARLSWDSRVLWETRLNVHHDTAITEDGEIYVLGREMFEVPFWLTKVWIINDSIHLLSAGGEMLDTMFVYDVLGDLLTRRTLWDLLLARLLPHNESTLDRCDVFHTNTLEIIDRDLGGLPTKGSFLLCARELDLVAIVDPSGQQVVWSWGPGALELPHQPSVTRDGRILIFDNGFRRGYSRVIEVDPADARITWEYRGDPPASFFSPSRGGAQELTNHNILITESDRGRAFEVTRNGDIVWEYWNPDLVENAHGRIERGVIYRMTRIEAPVVESLLDAHAGSEPARSGSGAGLQDRDAAGP